MGWMALLWFATVTSRTSTSVGLVGVVYGVPGIVLGPVIGNILDLSSPKQIVIRANILLGALFLAIPILLHLHLLPESTLLALVLAAGCLTPFTTVGWMVIVPRIVSVDDLGTANAIAEAIWQGAAMIGPMVGGMMIAATGVSLSITLDGISFWVAACCVSLLRMPNASAKSPKPNARLGIQGFWFETLSGFRTMRRIKPVWWITIGSVILNAAYGQLEISLPMFAHHQLSRGAVLLGTLWTTYFIASLVGASLSALMPNERRKGIRMSLMCVGYGLSYLPMIWLPCVWMVYLAMALGGLLFGGYPPLARTVVQGLVPENQRGRILGIRSAIIAMGMPIGSYISGTLQQWTSASTIIGCTGAIVTLVGLISILVRDLRSM